MSKQRRKKPPSIPREPSASSEKRKRGRPRTHPLPDPIPDTPENVARILMNTKPKSESEWQYLKNVPGSDSGNRKL